MQIPISLIVARSENDVIGCENRLPWRVPEDLKRFKQHTMDKALIMGRKTFESIGKPLPGRLNVVLSRNPTFEAPEGVVVCTSFQEGLSVAQKYSARKKQTEIMVIGGAEIFSEALDHCSRVYLSTIPLRISGDAFFPADRVAGWPVRHTEEVRCTSGDVDKFEFTILCRRADANVAELAVA